MRSRLPSFALSPLVALARRYMEQEPSQILGPDDDVYMRRWYLERDGEAKQGNVYLHETLRSDADIQMHCHPFDNMSIVLEGIVHEHTPDGVMRLVPGDIVVRRATDRHRLMIDAPVKTLFLTGTKIRDWGFHDSEMGYIPSQEFFRMRGDM